GAAGSITGPATVCAQSTQNYSIPAVDGASSYNWSIPSDATITSGANTNAVTIQFGNSGGTITVLPVSGCGTGAPSNLPVTIIPAANASVSIAASATSICSGTPVTFTATPVNGGT